MQCAGGTDFKPPTKAIKKYLEGARHWPTDHEHMIAVVLLTDGQAEKPKANWYQATQEISDELATRDIYVQAHFVGKVFMGGILDTSMMRPTHHGNGHRKGASVSLIT